MKVSEVIAYLQKYQQEFGDVDLDLNIEGAQIMPDGSASKADPTTEPKKKDDDLDKEFNSLFGGPITINPIL